MLPPVLVIRHPFSVSSGPHDDGVEHHIRALVRLPSPTSVLRPPPPYSFPPFPFSIGRCVKDCGAAIALVHQRAFPATLLPPLPCLYPVGPCECETALRIRTTGTAKDVAMARLKGHRPKPHDPESLSDSCVCVYSSSPACYAHRATTRAGSWPWPRSVLRRGGARGSAAMGRTAAPHQSGWVRKI